MPLIRILRNITSKLRVASAESQTNRDLCPFEHSPTNSQGMNREEFIVSKAPFTWKGNSYIYIYISFYFYWYNYLYNKAGSYDVIAV